MGEARASLWSDAWRELRRRAGFWVAALILGAMAMMAAFPWLLAGGGPNGDCDLRMAKHGPSSWNPLAAGGHPFGFDVHGCDYWSQVVNGARAPIVIGFAVTG